MEGTAVIDEFVIAVEDAIGSVGDTVAVSETTCVVDVVFPVIADVVVTDIGSVDEQDDGVDVERIADIDAGADVDVDVDVDVDADIDGDVDTDVDVDVDADIEGDVDANEDNDGDNDTDAEAEAEDMDAKADNNVKDKDGEEDPWWIQ